MHQPFKKIKKNSKFIRLSKIYLNLLKTKSILTFFIGNLKRHQWIKLYKLTATKSLFLQFLCNLEFRLEFLLLKSSIAITGKQARQLILHKHILVNKKVIISPSFKLKIGDFVSINKFYIKQYKQLLICNLFKTILFFNFLKKQRYYKRIRTQHIFSHLKFPFFVETNFKIFTICIIRKPSFNEFFFTNILSFYDYSQLYFLL